MKLNGAVRNIYVTAEQDPCPYLKTLQRRSVASRSSFRFPSSFTSSSKHVVRKRSSYALQLCLPSQIITLTCIIAPGFDPAEDSIYNYIPNKGVAITMIALFGLSTCESLIGRHTLSSLTHYPSSPAMQSFTPDKQSIAKCGGSSQPPSYVEL